MIIDNKMIRMTFPTVSPKLIYIFQTTLNQEWSTEPSTPFSLVNEFLNSNEPLRLNLIDYNKHHHRINKY